MKRYYRLMLGRKSAFAPECVRGNFIGVDFGLSVDLTNELTEDWTAFNQKFRPLWLEQNPDKSKITAGLACGSIWTVSKGINAEDVVLCPDGAGAYHVGIVTGGYEYHPGTILPHRRAVRWLPEKVQRSDMTSELKNSTGSIGTVCEITKYAEEIDNLIGGTPVPDLIASDENVEDATVFALEKHLEDFLVSNWQHTELGKRYDIFEEEGELVGQQYPSDTGPIDILAISKDRKEILVVELKKGRVSDVVVGQIQRYMGFCLDELAEPGQTVKGVIIGLEDDTKLRRALRVTKDIDFYRYQIRFELIAGQS